MMTFYLFLKQVFSRTCLVDECFCNLLIFLFLFFIISFMFVRDWNKSTLFLKFNWFLWRIFHGMSIDTWVKDRAKQSLSLGLIIDIFFVNQALVFQNVSPAPQSRKEWQGDTVVLFHRCKEAHQKVRCAIWFFTPGTQIGVIE